MTNQPVDPAAETIKQAERETSTYEGQQGHGVEFEQERYQSDNMQDTPDQGRSGSYETNNLGGYGTGQPNADGEKQSDD